MTTFGRWPGRSRGPRVTPAGVPRHPSTGDRAGRPALTLVRGRDPYGSPVDLRTLTRSPMPGDVRGALVTSADRVPGGRLQVVWLPVTAPARIPPGEIALSWTGARKNLVEVTARLGLVGGPVLLAVWPGLGGDWSDTVRPTVAGVRELHAALRLATAALECRAGRPATGIEGTEGTGNPDLFPRA
ncbi:hypothetical protein ACWD5R_30955 [Streptomyces sp. NPDC002514]|uniref:hypothetical protein n=1 Tax=Streptomyces sp. NPDC001270 TaxID=3364554 RepID=UPI0036A462CE